MKVVESRDNCVWLKAYVLVAAATFFILYFFLVPFSFASDFSSTNFVDQDPVILSSGGLSTSTNFQVISGTAQNEIGESSSLSFGYRSGFFYFPLVSSPTVIATAGNSLVQLSWTAAVGSLGFSVGSYQVGQSTSVNGPFTFTSVGNVLNSSRSGLSNGTPYYFVIRAHDVFGTPISTSSAVVATPSGSGTTPSGGGGSVGGSGSNQTFGSIRLSGTTIPKGLVTVLLNGVPFTTTFASAGSTFNLFLNKINTGNNILTLYVTDQNGLRSAPSTFTVVVESEKTSVINNIILAPTLTTDKESIAENDSTLITGYSTPSSIITIFIEGKKNLTIETTTNETGYYSVSLPVKNLPAGSYRIEVKSKTNNVVSNPSRPVNISIGDKTVPREQHDAACPSIADFNSDCKVDLVDFSILMYWFNRTNPTPNIDLRRDNEVNIIDFSVMMYYWTG